MLLVPLAAVRVKAAARAAEIWRVLRTMKPAARALATRGQKGLRRLLARTERRIILTEFGVRRRIRRHVRAIVAVALVILIAVSAALAPALQTATGAYFDAERFAVLRNLLATAGGALIGATAIGFSVVMIAVQLNFARMPHGLFRKLSSDVQLLGTFATTFLLAIAVAVLSLVPDATWSAFAVISAGWGTLLILILFFYGYRRALVLINPVAQLSFIVTTARKDLRRWARRAGRMAPLLDIEKDNPEPPTAHDVSRIAFFHANSQWTGVARQAVSHAISFARRFGEQGDYEVARGALSAVTVINAAYVAAKGRTFFAHNPIFDIPETSDGFINETLEQLRQIAQAATTRGEEEPLRQVLAAMAALVQTYMAIDYASPQVDVKEHAQLAAAYLAGAVESVLPHSMPDVVMEGVRLMGVSAQLFIAAGQPNGIVPLAEKIAGVACTGALKLEYRPVTLVGVEQLARLTFDLLRTTAGDIDFAASQIQNCVEGVVKLFLNVPDAPFTSVHSTFLAPYFSLSKVQTLGSWLTNLCNAIIDAKDDDKNAERVVANLETWTKELYRTQKTLLLLAIEKKSFFTFDLLHWIAHVTKLLNAVARAPVTDDHARKDIEKHASWLVSVISWIPEDRESTAFAESFSITETLFDLAMDTFFRNNGRVAERVRLILIDWTFKAGRNATGWGTLENGLQALVTVVLSKEDVKLVTWLKSEVTKRLEQEDALDAEIRDRTARNLRQTAVSFRRRELELNSINRVMGDLDPVKLRELLTEIADILSPGTAGECVIPDLF